MTTRPKALSINEPIPRPDRAGRGGIAAWAAAAVLAVAIGAIYSQSLNAPFIFDDNATILTNNSIVSLWPLFGTNEHPGALCPPAPLPTAGRPAVNLSFAINYLVGGLAPVGYHVVNVFIHFGSALLLWAIVKRTLRLAYFAGRFESAAGWLALAVSLVWALHPLQTEAVIYTTQRTELLMAFFYLATLYCSLRYWAANTRRTVFAWLTLAVFACLAGMASKEVMASAPLMVLLFDRTFVAGSLHRAIRRSRPLYLGLASTWLLLLLLNLNAPRGDSAGFNGGPSLIAWWLTQSQVVLMYMKLVIWPWPQLLHYQLPYLESFGSAWLYVAPVLLLAIVTLFLLYRNHPVGYLGTWVFAILAPTSIVPILTEVAAERRMYLPLAAIAVIFVIGGCVVIQFLTCRMLGEKQWRNASRVPSLLAILMAICAAIALGIASAKRVSAYNDPVALWRDVIRHEPNNFVAHGNLGGLLVNDANCQKEAMDELQAALSLKPDYPAALANLGVALIHAGRLPEAIDTLHRSLALQPNYSVALNALGIAFSSAGQFPKAVETLQAALVREPNAFDLLNNLGLALTEMGRPAEAIPYLERASRVEPGSADARNNLGRALTNAGRLPEAIAALEAARELTPKEPLVLNNLGYALTQSGRLEEAIAVLQQALRIRPDYSDAHNNLAIALVGDNQTPQAIEHFRLGIKFNPKNANIHTNLANLAVLNGDLDEAIAHYKEAVALQPNRDDFHASLADVLRKSGQTKQAIEHYQIALRLKPDDASTYAGLAQALAQLDRSKEAIAAAEKAIAFSRSSGQPAIAEQAEEWLKHYQTELRRAADATPSNPTQSATEAKKPQ